MNAQLKIAGQSPELLGLESLLVSSLPATLMTDDAPDHDTVEAVFTRKNDRDEVAAIQGGETRARLSESGFPTVERPAGATARRTATIATDDDARIAEWVDEGGAVPA